MVNMYTFRFCFLKAVSGKLMQPHVGPFHEWTGEKLKQLTGQGDLYIQPSYLLRLEVRIQSWYYFYAG